MSKKVVASLVAGALLLSACTGKPQDPEPVVPAPVTPIDTPSTGGQTPPPAPEPIPEPEPEPEPEPQRREIPYPQRGIHISGWYAGSPDLAGPLLEWCLEAGINTLVLDIKAEDGKLSWISDIPLAQEIGANTRKIGDFEKFVTEAKEMGFWVVGRIVVMNDSSLYSARPEWGIPGFSGGPYSFMDPRNENVWEYNFDIARAAVEAGVDEIQWDYIRYPEKLIPGYNGKDTTAEYRLEPIKAFLQRSVEILHPMGAYVSADVFGLTTSVEEGDDMEIGQDYRKVAEIVDFVSAMVYPSHYAPGTYGLGNPNANPYETVHRSLEDALKRTEGIPIEKHRPWIQDFSMGGVTYGPDEIRAQVQALRDLGIESFLLWDPSNRYNRSVSFIDSN